MPDTLTLLADRFDPPQVDVFALLGYTPNPRQAEFHAATEDRVLYGGAAYGGKSRALVMDDVRDAVRYPGIRILAVRRTYDELEESLLLEVRQLLPQLEVEFGCRFRERPYPELRFPRHGSVIRYRHAANVKHASRRLGGGYQKLTADELTQIPPDVVDHLEERLRANPRFAHVPVVGTRAATNPGGVGHGRVKTRYVEATVYGTRVVVDEHGFRNRFVPAKATDNPYLTPEYMARLDAIPDPARRKAMRDGDWDTFSGQVFTLWSHDRHVVKPFTLPASWRRTAGIDHGYAAPWCVLWGAQDPDRRVWIYREIYETKVNETDQALRILRAEGNLRADGAVLRQRAEQVARYADPSMWAKKGEANPVAYTYSLNGCTVAKAVNDRLTGVQRVHSFLADGPACEHHRRLGWTVCPLVHVFDTCSNLIRTLPNLPADETDPEDVDTDSEDHAYDALRYLVMSLALPAAHLEPLPPEPVTMEERLRADMNQKRFRRRTQAAGNVLGRY